MAITTQIVGTLQRESYMFQPVAGTRYYLPKGKYQIAVIKSGSGSIGHTASSGSTFTTSSNAYTHPLTGIEWIEFTGNIWRVLIAPVVNTAEATPPTTRQ